MQQFWIGHGAYGGANRPQHAKSYANALMILAMRRVPLEDAQRALKSAMEGSHATCSTRNYGIVEVVAIPRQGA